MIMVIKRVEYGISYYDLIKENFHAQIYHFSPVCVRFKICVILLNLFQLQTNSNNQCLIV